MKSIIFVGWVNQGKAPVDGETTKNQYIIAELKKYCKVTVLDFYEKNRHPWIYLQALWTFITQPKATIILSTSAKNVYGMLKLLKALHIRRDIIHWVIGGAFGKYVQEGRFRADVFNYVKYNLVQCKGMIAELESAGVTNARFVSNFKPIPYYPDLENALAARAKSKTLRFVFLSRVMPDKGCDYILEAVRRLNAKGLQHRFSVAFYGKIDAAYSEQFLKEAGLLENVAWHGLLDLRSNEGYDTLGSYHAMLFPTFHPTEGFAGVMIDAFIASLPVLASDWAHNAEAITDGKQGIIYPVHNVEALTSVMEKCISGQVDLQAMARNVRAEAPKYETKNVITEDYLKSIGLMEDKNMRRKVLAVASIGGHWIQLLRIARPLEEHYEMVYMCTHPKCAAIVEGKKYYLATDFSRSDAWKLIPTFFRQLNIIRKEKPDVIITTGAAPGLICVIAGWLLRRKTIWIDSIANVNHLSLSGRVAALFVSKVYTQWQHLAKDKIHYAGDIFG